MRRRPQIAQQLALAAGERPEREYPAASQGLRRRKASPPSACAAGATLRSGGIFSAPVLAKGGLKRVVQRQYLVDQQRTQPGAQAAHQRRWCIVRQQTEDKSQLTGGNPQRRQARRAQFQRQKMKP